MFSCQNCGKEFKDNCDLERHKNRKYPCNRVIAKIKSDNNDNIYECEYCNKTYSSTSVLYRHQRDNCKKKQNIPSAKEFKKLKKDFENLKKELDTIKVAKQNNIGNEINGANGTIFNGDNNTQINNTITIVPFGKEDLSHLTTKDWIKVFKNNYKAMEALTKLTHFDEDKPENHNIYISGQKSKYAMVHNGKDWVLKDRNDTVGDLYGDKAYIIFNKIDELSDEIPFAIMDKFNKIREDYDNDKIEKTMVKSLDTLLLNNRKIPIETKKQNRIK